MRDSRAFDFDGDYGDIYDHIARTVIPGYEQLFPATLAVFRQLLGRDAHILVAGCGTGRETCAFLANEPGWRVTAVDPSAAMVGATRQAAVRLGVGERLEVYHGVAADLTGDELFDAATLINVMHFVADDGGKQDLVASLARRLGPRAPLALFDLHGEPGTPAFRMLSGAWSDFIEQRGLTGSEKVSFLTRIEQGIVYVPEDRILEICERAGLELQHRYFGGLLYGGWIFRRRD